MQLSFLPPSCPATDQDIKETNLQVNHQPKEFKWLESKVDNLIDHLTFLEQVNIKKEGRIDYLEGVVQSMSNKLCWCGNQETSVLQDKMGEESSVALI